MFSMEHVLHKLNIKDVVCSTYPIKPKNNSRSKKKNGDVAVRKNKAYHGGKQQNSRKKQGKR